MKKHISKKLYLRYKFQSELLDSLALNNGPVQTTNIVMHMSHFKNCKIETDEIKMVYDELSFLETVGLCVICDKEGVRIDSTEKYIETRLKKKQPIHSVLTEKGIEAVQNRTYESLYISTYLNYRMYKLSRISIFCAFISIIIAVIAIFYTHLQLAITNLF